LQLLPQAAYLQNLIVDLTEWKNRIADLTGQEKQRVYPALAAAYLEHLTANLIPGPPGTPVGMKTGKDC